MAQEGIQAVLAMDIQKTRPSHSVSFSVLSFYVERIIGSIRRECLNHMIILNENHLHRILEEYFEYYHDVRPHQSLDKDSPMRRDAELPKQGNIVSIPMVGGLHHVYRRAA